MNKQFKISLIVLVAVVLLTALTVPAHYPGYYNQHKPGLP